MLLYQSNSFLSEYLLHEFLCDSASSFRCYNAYIYLICGSNDYVTILVK